MSTLNHRKQPDRLLEIFERVYLFDCCLSNFILEEDEYKGYLVDITAQLQHYFPDASFMVFNFREGDKRSQISDVLSQYDMTVMDYPRQYQNCQLLSLEMIHHFLRSSESWLSLGQENVLLLHCERGGWPVLAFMLAALMLYLKIYSGEQKTLDLVYKQAPKELLRLLDSINPQPSQLRYLQYISRRSVDADWPPSVIPLSFYCLILRNLPVFDGGKGCRPLIRIYGQDPSTPSDTSSKLVFSNLTTKKNTRHYTQAECVLVKMDISCSVQGDVVIECLHLNEDLVHEKMMFRVMFHTAYVSSNILTFNCEDIDILWDAKEQFSKDFKSEVLFSDADGNEKLAASSEKSYEAVRDEISNSAVRATSETEPPTAKSPEASKPVEATTQAQSGYCEPITQWKHDVFISFRGDDTRKGFLSHLYHELERTKLIRIFMDDIQLEKGKIISQSLLTAIEESRFAIIVLSERYAFSTWCLDELSKIFQCMENKYTILPIFYHVDPSDVRYQKSSFGVAFEKHENHGRHATDKVKQWRADITKVGNISGWDSKDYKSERELIEDIVKFVLKEVIQVPKRDFKEFEATKVAIAEINKMLMDKKGTPIGVYGRGGVGKTTMVKHIGAQAKINGLFDHVIMAVVSRKPDLKKIQGALANQLGLKLVVDKVKDGASRLKQKIIEEKRILIILDDILENIDLCSIGIPSYQELQSCNSKVLLTTRMSSLCHSMGCKEAIPFNILSEEEYLKLFMKMSRKPIHGSSDSYDQERSVVEQCSGPPSGSNQAAKPIEHKFVEEWNEEVSKAFGYTSDNNDEIIYLPRLNILKVYISDAACLSKDIGNVEINWINFEICIGRNFMLSWNDQYSRTLTLDRTIHGLPDWFIEKVTEKAEKLEYIDCKGVNNMLEEYEHGKLYGLKHLSLNGSPENLEGLINATTWDPSKPVFESLEELHLLRLKFLSELCVGELPLGSLCKLKLLKVQTCRNVVSALLPSKLLQILTNLETVYCINMEDMKYVFGSEGLDPGKILLTKLNEMRLCSLFELLSIWNGPAPHAIFGNLKILAVCECPKLKILFPFEIAQSLVQLEDLSIERCSNLVRVIEAPSSYDRYMFFPQLKKLSLVNLPELTRLCTENGSIGIECPLLESLCVDKCPQFIHTASAEVKVNDQQHKDSLVKRWSSAMQESSYLFQDTPLAGGSESVLIRRLV